MKQTNTHPLLWAILPIILFLLSSTYLFQPASVASFSLAQETLYPPTMNLRGETGSIILTGAIDNAIFMTINTVNSYTDPVVVAFINTRVGVESVDVRVRNITANSFDLFMEEPDDQGHTAETVSYIVMEKGRFVLDGNLVVEAGTVDTNSVHVGGSSYGGTIISFSEPFITPPTVLHSLNSYNNGEFISSVAHTITASNFTVQQEAAETGHEIGATTETIGWIAFSVGTGTTNGSAYEIDFMNDGTSDGVDDTPHLITFTTFLATPDLIVKGNSGNGNDGYWARGAGIYTNANQSVYSEEDQILDLEQTHSDETFAWAAFDNSTIFVQANCLIETNGDNLTDYASLDATALQTAVNAANPGDLLKVAGICAGINTQGGLTQTVYINTDINIIGGYDGLNWLGIPDPLSDPTLLDAEGNGRVVRIIAGNTVLLENLTLTNGYFANVGGGIENRGELTLRHSIVSNNTSIGNGAGIYNSDLLLVENSWIVNNNTTGGNSWGGGFHQSASGITTIRDSMILHNDAGIGGGISNRNGDLLLENTTIYSNTVRLPNASSDGAGILNRGGSVRIINSTISSNGGSGISNWQNGPSVTATLTLSYTTIADNDKQGLRQIADNTIPQVYGTIVSSLIINNNLFDCLTDEGNGAVFNSSAGYNLDSDGSCVTDGVNNNSSSATPLLDIIQDNGGTVTPSGDAPWTHALLAGSPAFNQIPIGTNGCGTTYTTDQRGASRLQFIACDMGSYESTTLLPSNCSVEATGDTVTDYASPDASAIQWAVDNATSGDTLKIAGICAGTSTTGGITQTAYINKSLTLIGGYEATDWTTSNPTLYPTLLDAQSEGRVIRIPSGNYTVTLTSLNLTQGRGANSGGGIFAAGTNLTINISNTHIYSNTASGLGAGLYLSQAQVTIANSHIYSNTSANSGAGIYNAGTSGLLTIDNSLIDNNTITSNSDGAGLGNAGYVIMTNTTIQNNFSGRQGGGISNENNGTMSIVNGLIISNTATTFGGAIINGGALSITNTSMSYNQASASGGAIHSPNSSSLLTITDSLLSHNQASSNGGGLSHAGGIATLENSTISQNIGEGTSSWAGAVALNLNHNTIISNTGFGISQSAGVVTATNNLVAYNTSTDCSGTISSGGYNLASDSSCTGFINTGDTQNSDPIADDLADNGGTPIGMNSSQPMLTHALLTGSPAFNQIPLAVNGCGTTYTTDQRGITRPQFGACDIGAYESTSLLATACTVEANGDNLTDYASLDATALQTAVNNANPGDLLKVAGICAGINTQGGVTQTVYISQSLTIQGGYTYTNWLTAADPASYPTTLDAQSNGRVLSVAGGAGIAVTLEGLIISNGDASKASITNQGGGLIIGTDTAVNLTNSQLNNHVADLGAGVFMEANSTLTLTQSMIDNNQANTSGGGIYNDNGTLTIQTSSQIINNIAMGDLASNGGGGVYHTNGTLTLNSASLINNNMATGLSGSGGGLFFQDGLFNMQSANIDGNSANRSGGGVAIVNGIASMLGNTRINNNDVNGSAGLPNPGNGGGLHISGTGSVTFNNAIVSSNQAANSGGGFAIESTGTLNLIATQTNNNSAHGTGGGGIYNNGGTLTVTSGAGPSIINVNNATAGAGGAILSLSGDITLDSNSTVQISNLNSNQAATDGGAIAMTGGTLTIDQMILSTNSALGNGGGIFTSNSTTTIENSTFNNNQATNGGAIYRSGSSTMTVNNSRFLTNQATAGSGGAINWGCCTGGTKTILNSLFDGNNAANNGGAISVNSGGNSTIVNSTFINNSATNGGAASISLQRPASFYHVTIISNTATNQGGGLYLFAPFLTTPDLHNSLISGNSAPAGTDCGGSVLNQVDAQSNVLGMNGDDGGCTGFAASSANNVTPTGDLTTIVDTDINGNPLLADNGGATKTIALIPTSPAINAGDNALLPNESTFGIDGDGDSNIDDPIDYDQRGFLRPQVVLADAGAYESAFGPCSVETNGDNIADYTGDAAALQTAVNAAVPGTLLKVAGICAGINTQGGVTQTLYISQNLTIQGGYDGINWLTVPDSELNPTTLDAQSNGRVVYLTNGSNVTMTHLTLTGGNWSGGSGGGIYIDGTTLQLDYMKILSNTTVPHGGGIANIIGNLTVNHSTFNGNLASGSRGGAVYNTGGNTNIAHSTFYNNQASNGGALYNTGGTLTIVNSTVSTNNAFASNGGGIYSDGATTTIIHSTIVSNTATNGGGIFATSSSVNLSNSILAYNGGNCLGSIFTDNGYNVASDGSCNLTAPSSSSNSDPLLAPLADNGGESWTHALATKSPAIDLIPSGTNGCGTTYTTDQLNSSRPQGINCDAGAYEFVGVAITTPLTLTINNGGGTVANLLWTDNSSQCMYQVYRSTAPYIGYTLFTDNWHAPTYDDTGAIGNPAINYYYYINAYACGNNATTNSNEVAEFDFTIIPGS